jgi:RNA polymerase primary sigma factor
MNHDIVPVSAELAEDIVFESELIPSYGDMEMMLTQEGVQISRHVKTFLSEIASLPALDADGAADLASRLDSDPAAKSDLIEGLMRIVVCAAKRYTGRGVTFLDLLQEGSLGLVGAAETYSPEDGDFRLHAAGCVLDALEFAAADAEMTGEIPAHLTELLNTISRSDMVLEEKLGREATPEEIAEDTGLALDEVLSVMELMEEIASQDNVEAAAEEETAETEDADAESEEPRARWDAGRRTNS